MDDTTTTVEQPVQPEQAESAGPPAVEDELTEDVLVEEVSIDGMCGVY